MKQQLKWKSFDKSILSPKAQSAFDLAVAALVAYREAKRKLDEQVRQDFDKPGLQVGMNYATSGKIGLAMGEVKAVRTATTLEAWLSEQQSDGFRH